MKFDTLSALACMPEHDITSLKVYYGGYSTSNLILNIKNLEKMNNFESDLVFILEQNEEVESYLFVGKELKVLIK